MDAVRSFNNELSSLYEGKPPVSRAKMAQVTKCAIKAIKFYKHVVQSVEKFIQKCKPEYKVPGLYVIDSIVRQSRHQFGPEKDVFSPRFTKNIVNTFTNLFKCPVEERSRVVRVLNLWQKNSVFPMEVVQPLLDLAADPNNSELVMAAQRAVDAVVSVTQKVPLPGTHSSSNGSDSNSNQILQQTEMLSTITKLLQQAQEGSISGTAPESQLQQLQDLQQQLVMQTERISKPHQQTPPIDSNLLAQIQVLTNQLLSKTSGSDDTGEDDVKGNSGEPLFNKKLLDFDYGDSDDDDDRQDHHHHHHFQQRQAVVPQYGMPPMMHDQNRLQQIQIQQMSQQQEQLQSEIGAQEQLRRRVLEQQQFDREIGQAAMVGHHPQHGFGQNMDIRPDNEQDERDVQEGQDRADFRRRRGSRERSRSPRRRSRRSRSRSRDRRKRSRSRDRHRRSRSRDRERREREKERDRKKKGLPALRENNISICSKTLWFGHLTKHTTEKELREHIENYGTIRTINMIPPRGCAFVCLTNRKDAFKALDRLKGIKINGNSLKVAWAPGIGVKESIFKDLWDVEQGVTYIPWEQLPADLTPFIAGGMIDEDSLPERLKGIKTNEEDLEEPQQQQDSTTESGVTIPEDNTVSPQLPPPQMPMGMPGQLTNFQLAGQGLLSLLAPGGPLSLLAGPPPMGMQPGIRGSMGGPGNMGGPNNMGGLNNLRLPNNMGGLNNIGGPNNMRGMHPGQGPNLPGMRPGQMNMGPQGPMMGQGNRMGGPMGVPSPGMDMRSSPVGMNSPGLRRPFGHFGNMPRFPHMQSPGGMRPPFFNNDGNDGDHPGMRDRDIRGMAEPKEWPPDDEVNAEDEEDEDIDSDERMMHMGGQQRMSRPGMLNMRAMGNPFGPRGPPMLPGQGSSMQQMLSLHMMPPGHGGSGPNFGMPQGGLRIPMPAVGVRPGMVPGSASPRLLPPSTGAPLPVSVNGSIVATRPGLPPSNDEGNESPDIVLPNSDMSQSPEEDMMRPHPQGHMSLMRMQGGNRPPSGPFLGRGFAPMTIRPRGGPGLLGLRPGAHGGGGFNRFGGPRSLMGPFGGMDRFPFGNRFGMPLRPPMGFFDQSERGDIDDSRTSSRDILQNLSMDKDLDNQNLSDDMDEEREVSENKDELPEMDTRRDDRSKLGRASGRPSRWHDEEMKPESATDAASAAPASSSPPTTEVIPAPSQPAEGDKEASTPVEVQTSASIPPAESDDASAGLDIAPAVASVEDASTPVVVPTDTTVADNDGENKTQVDAETNS